MGDVALAVNRELLREFWRPLAPRQEADDVHWVDKIVYARLFAEAKLPEFHQAESPSQSVGFLRRLVPIRLTGAGNATQLAAFRAGLDELAAAQRELRDALDRDRADRSERADGESAPAGYGEFLGLAGRRWTRVWHLVEALLDERVTLRLSATDETSPYPRVTW